VFVAVMVPLVFFFSATKHFQEAYPFYHSWRLEDDGWGRLLLWEALYACQFIALEFFFRGFMVHGLKHRFGVYSVFVMTVPYCMIHFQKPLPECVASIIAGVALGLMSLKTRSVWLGAALHISVAWGMDVCSLFRKGAFTPFYGPPA
jgi:membrane protease YdiL (CAAX protease family)